MGQNQWYHFGVGAAPILVCFRGDWDVHWEVQDFDPWPGGKLQAFGWLVSSPFQSRPKKVELSLACRLGSSVGNQGNYVWFSLEASFSRQTLFPARNKKQRNDMIGQVVQDGQPPKGLF